MDGTFFRRQSCLIAILDGKSHACISGAYPLSENSRLLLSAYFLRLRANGLHPASATVDGGRHMISALREMFPGIVIQRCLVHVQRQGLMWCRANPKRTDARHLRNLFLRVSRINTSEDRDAFLSDVQKWETRFGTALAETPERGRVVSDIIRARSMLQKALPDMFHYLDDPGIPRTTSMIEGYFSRLKELYRRHRGLAKARRAVYFAWHFVISRR